MRPWPRERVKERVACMHCVCVCECLFMFVCGDTDAVLQARGIQPFASGKGRHDEVMLTVCNLRSDIFLTRFCFCFFILIPRPVYQIHQFNSRRWGRGGRTTITNLSTLRRYDNYFIFLLFII